MRPISAQTAETLDAVLAQYGLAGATVHDIRTGRVNKHWRIETAGASHVLRRYNTQRSVDAIGYERDVLRHMDARGWPVAPPLPVAGGNSTLVEADGRRYTLFRLLPGRPAPYNLRNTRLRGGLLAQLHQDMAAWEAPGQRDGFGRVWELDIYVAAQCGSATFNELLMAFGQTNTELARAIRAQKYATLRELSTLGYGELPAVLGHFDIQEDNLLFQRGELSGVLDFDFVHLDARVVDIAESISLGCLAPPAYNEIDPVATRAFVAGYMEHTALSDAELQLVVPLLRAAILWLVQWRLSQWAEGERGGEPLRSIRRSVAARFPSLARKRDELEAAVLQAASES